MDQEIRDALDRTKDAARKELAKDLADDQAFSYAIIDNFRFEGEEAHLRDISEMITDGPNDGGIDFVYFDDDEPCVVLGQSKCVGKLDAQDVADEISKMHGTIVGFQNNNFGTASAVLKEPLLNALDSLQESDSGSIQYHVYATCSLNKANIEEKIRKQVPDFDCETSLFIHDNTDIAEQINSNMEQISAVAEGKLELDKSKNRLEYQAQGENGRKGVFVNVLSRSLKKLYAQYSNKGLLSKNIRGYVRKATIDSAILNTIEKESDDFWFFNNGITIACDDYYLDGTTVKMYNFSIVNGGQTTYLIAKSKDLGKDFSIPCKIVAKGEEDTEESFFLNIAEATNSQKAIQLRDLKSNSPEMLKLQSLLGKEGINFEIKRGSKNTVKNETHKIKNDAFGQIVLSFVYQKPGTARSGKKQIFENPDVYGSIFRQPYQKQPDMKAFIVDLVDFNTRYGVIEGELKKNAENFNEYELAVLKNGKLAIFAAMGILYDIANNDITPELARGISEDESAISRLQFVYGSFLSNYDGDDIDSRLKELIIALIKLIAEQYKFYIKDTNGSTTVTNFLKTDSKYQNKIMAHIVSERDGFSIAPLIKNAKPLLTRKPL